MTVWEAQIRSREEVKLKIGGQAGCETTRHEYTAAKGFSPHNHPSTHVNHVATHPPTLVRRAITRMGTGYFGIWVSLLLRRRHATERT